LSANAQQASNNNLKIFSTDTTALRDAKRFISERKIVYDIVEPVQFSLDFAEVFDSISSSNINYTHSIHGFYGKQINSNMWTGLICESRGGGVPKKYIFYRVIEYENSIDIEVLFGNNDW